MSNKVTIDLDDFTKAYIECALWSSMDNYGTEDIHPDALAGIVEDCRQFRETNGVPSYGDPRYSDAEKAGHDFWLTRNRHGAGFWDRGLGDIGDKLTEAAHAWGSVDLYVGDDDMIHSG